MSQELIGIIAVGITLGGWFAPCDARIRRLARPHGPTGGTVRRIHRKNQNKELKELQNKNSKEVPGPKNQSTLKRPLTVVQTLSNGEPKPRNKWRYLKTDAKLEVSSLEVN